METDQIKIKNRLIEISEKIDSFFEKKKNELTGNKLLTFAVEIGDIDFAELLNTVQSKYNTSLFFSSPTNHYSFIALNSNGNLSTEETNWEGLFSQVRGIDSTNNFDEYNLTDIPLLLAGVKFDSSRTSDEWSGFKTFHVFIPEIILYKTNERNFIIFNKRLTSETDRNFILNNFKENAQKIFDIFNSVSSNSVRAELKPVTGNSNLKKEWIESVKKARAMLNNELKKMVLARRLEFEVEGKIDWQKKMKSLRDEYPGCYLFVFMSGYSVFFGASPEKFIKIEGNNIELDALAGSAPGHQVTEQSLLNNDKKNLTEHKFVIDFIKEQLNPFVNRVEIEEEPHIKKLSNVQHLHTKVTAQLKSKDNLAELMDALYPTPAVCGLPKAKAFKAIRQIEKFDRGLYSGIVGWISAELNCEFTVAIRSALLKNNKLFAYSGAGIVKDSVPEDEFTETELKLKTILNLFDDQYKSK